MASVYKPTARSDQDTQMYNNMKASASDTVQKSLNTGYKPNSQVQASYDNWQKVQAQKPVDYSSTYTQQLDDLLNKITSRPKFSYDVNADMLYRQARDQYMLNGQRAMKDTIGRASAMTGGYGNSYAASAGNQAYQQYLTQLAGMMPEYYDRALQAYQAEGDQLQNQYSAVANREANDYARYRDEVGDWNTAVDRAMQTYNTMYNQDYGQYSDQLGNAYNALGQAESVYQADRNYGLNAAQLAAQQEQFNEEQALNNKQYASSIALQLLGSGQMPSAELLNAAGISSADAQSFIRAWNAAHAPAPAAAASSGGGSSGNQNKGNNNKQTTNTPTNWFTSVINATKAAAEQGKVVGKKIDTPVNNFKYGAVSSR